MKSAGLILQSAICIAHFDMTQTNDAPSRLVAQIHASNTMAVIAVTGGGSGAIAALLEQPGASRTVPGAAGPSAAGAAAPPAWQELLAGEAAAVQVSGAPTAPRLVFPGAFNPLHEGHRQMAKVAARRLGAAVAFELSITNVDKPPLDFIEMQQRTNQ